MKKIFLLFWVVIIVTSFTGFAKIIRIQVSNFQFTPATVNAVAGDTLVWIWKNGTHTTTSLIIPAGAKPWDAPINSTHKKFGYKLIKTGVYNYQCTIHAATMKGKIIVSAALAAGMEDFTVNKDNGQLWLTWKTASSKDVSYFSVQRSTDAEHFSEIMKVAVNASNTYSFKDNAVIRHKYLYYQVEMVDAQGNRQLSPVQMVVNSSIVTAKLIISISPNPISSPGHLMLQFNADKEGSMMVKLFSQSGTFIKQVEMSTVKGLNNGHFHVGSLTPGTYYIVCTLGTITEKHLLVVK